MDKGTKITINAIRKNFVYAAEDMKLYRKWLEQARAYRLEGNRRQAIALQDIAAGYRELAITANKNALWWISVM